MNSNFIQQFIFDFLAIFNKMSPYLLLGFLFAGILKVFLPEKFITKHLSSSNFKSVFLSALLGIPMPLCSCGVIPTGISLHKNGASKGATISFLISTPQTGVDSILVTYSLLGLPFAILRVFIALITGILGGVLSNKIGNKTGTSGDIDNCCSDSCCSGNEPDSCCSNESTSSCCSGGSCCDSKENQHSKLYIMLKYAFVDFLQDISKWLIIGLILAAIISVVLPNDFFIQFIGNQWIEIVIILLATIPLYVCATGSVPIVVALMLKGLSPGAALVFLMAGPATNIATIIVLRKTLGKKTTWVYLFAIIFGAMFFGILINNFLPTEWFSLSTIENLNSEEFIPHWIEWICTAILFVLIINGFLQKKIKKRKHKYKQKNLSDMQQKEISVHGMTCNHCKKSVEDNLYALEGIKSVSANLENKTVYIEGNSINLDIIKAEIEKLGFDYQGEVLKVNFNASSLI